MEDMTYTIKSSEMSAIDTNCEYHGLSRLQLMENAGRGLAEEIRKFGKDKKILIFSGLGNNGGDAFVAVRHLRGFDITVFLLGKESEIKTDIAKRNFQLIKKVCRIKEIRNPDIELDDEFDIIVDAMLGTGVKGRLREPYSTAVELINSSDSFVVAVDVPTGLNPDTGEYDICVIADVTITFHKYKPGLLKASNVAGKVILKDIGIPEYLEKLAGPGDVHLAYKRRDDAHKGEHGRVLIVGGGEYTGAPALAALAALHSGADIVTLAVPESIKDIVAGFSPNLIVRGLKGSRISESNIQEIDELIKKHDVLVMGMGIGDKDFVEISEEILKGSVRRAVLDAEAITKDVPENVKCIITPHFGEFKRVFGRTPENEDEVKSFAKKHGITILLKSKKDIISDGEKIRVNESGNSGMTVGGTGDVLAGIVGALFCHADPLWSASASAFINGLAGDICFEEFGYNYTALDMLRKIPLAIKRSIEFL
ncbi:yjeF C-terminal region, hydroxyethylthiazole kinase-related/yjeF N-terminal region [Archaeoglobus sulfaticallidus PM70-1]|uniref:Bifunctional NAD(P)H-hydrate repair enzyme n=1 Tax=Archaeoglobus sulfaticallidus PM70-1 TaxID=387631 RepID=N0BMQ8_9EURY|nr:bifunctional ADP-dependent NAD(P)H-hydrate dehydratase/NAD(P)H-hydrate epimerase [Archaeoglobus sulfaticallidus]AGK61530.1 yjeF C-terminal region, hydroxyethylthiazole kinase-related/yjeF N-terminal region [Archaeoglobus sulfaticallidus PM70-1]